MYGDRYYEDDVLVCPECCSDDCVELINGDCFCEKCAYQGPVEDFLPVYDPNRPEYDELD